ncbi:MAG: hypothetical protein LUD27_03485 [Clostridia bacterium]|nr:hypothetical protein [Clostridia bacterium]
MKNKDNKNKDSLIFTRETLGMTILLFCAIVLVALLSHRAVFAGFGGAICTFMYGTFGYGCYFVVALLAYLGEWLAFEKKIKIKWQPALWCSLTILSLFLLFHTVTTRNFTFDGTYIAACYTSAESGWSGYTFGGVISSLIVYPVVKVTKFVGAYIIFSLLTVLFGYLSVMSVRKHYFKKKSGENVPAADEKRGRQIRETAVSSAEQVSANNSQPVYNGQPAYGAQPDYSGQIYNDGQQVYNGEQPYYGDNQSYGGQVVSDQFYPQQQYQAPSPMQQVFGAAEEPVQEQEEIDYKTMGRKILFDNGEFDAENYRRNGIFDENSYFNHPISNSDDYLKGFSDGKKTSGASIQPTYSEAYRQSVEEQPTGIPNSVYYGDEPTDKLEDFTPADTGAYTSPQSNADDQSESRNPYEVSPFTEDEREVQDDQPYYEEDFNDNPQTDSFAEDNSDVFTRQPAEDETSEDIFPSGRGDAFREPPVRDNDNLQNGRSDEFGSRQQAGFGERRFTGFEDSQTEDNVNDRSRDSSLNLSRDENTAGRNDGSSSLFTLFSSENSRLNEENNSVDQGRSSLRGAERGESSDLFGGRGESPRVRGDRLFGDSSEPEEKSEEPENRAERNNSDLFGGRDRMDVGRDRSRANLFDSQPEDEENEPDEIEEPPVSRPVLNDNLTRRQ